MNIVNAIEIARTCDLETIGDAIFNVELHANQLFSYSDIHKELDELKKQYKWLLKNGKTIDGVPITDETLLYLCENFLRDECCVGVLNEHNG